MGKAAYSVFESVDGKMKILVNAGAGLMTFKADMDDAESDSYFAINFGAKLYYMFNESVGFVASPQGDFAFVSADEDIEGDEDTKAWVWPFTAGLVFTF